MPEAWVWCAADLSWYKRKFVGQDVVIGPFGEFRSWTSPAVAFVQIARSRRVLKVFDEHAVEATFGSILPFSLSQSVTGSETSCGAFEIGRVAWTFGAVYRKAVGCVP